MLSLQFVFIVTVTLTTASGIAAASIVVFGDTRRNLGQRAVADKFAQIALIGTVAIGWPSLDLCRWSADAEFIPPAIAPFALALRLDGLRGGLQCLGDRLLMWIG